MSAADSSCEFTRAFIHREKTTQNGQNLPFNTTRTKAHGKYRYGGVFDDSLEHFHCGAFAVFDGTWLASTIVAVTCTVAFCRLFSSARSAINSESRFTCPAAFCRLSRGVVEHHDSVTHPLRNFAVSRSTTGTALRLRGNHGPSSGKGT